MQSNFKIGDLVKWHKEDDHPMCENIGIILEFPREGEARVRWLVPYTILGESVHVTEDEVYLNNYKVVSEIKSV
tara:strand:- start:179 stop:400 length:222 start_codon:yes stop_codon:yes gene_type:complete